jgi:PAS domain S-box-containing protein
LNWSYAYNPEIWPALFTLGITVFLGWYGWRRRKFSGTTPFVVLCLFMSLWVLGSVFEISATEFSDKVFWTKFQGIWQIPTATAMPWSVLELAGFRRWLTRRNFWLMTVPSVLTLLLIFTNDYHHLITTEVRMTDHVVQVFGIANWIITAYAFLLVLSAVIVLLWLAIRSHHLRRPATIMLLGMVVAFGFYTLASIDESLFGPGERVLLVLGPLSLSYSLAFFRYHILDPVPIARAAALEQVREGMLVLDLQGRIADSNITAAKIVGMPAEHLKGRLITETLPAISTIIPQPAVGEASESEIRINTGSASRSYAASFTPLSGYDGEPVGQLLLLRDVTEQKRTQAKVVEQQRVMATLQERERLARELHDSTSQVLGYVNLQAQTIQKWLQSGNNEKAEALLTRLAEIAKDAHADVRESILGLKSEGTEGWVFLSALKRYLNNFQSQYNIPIELTLSNHMRENTLNTTVGIQVLRVIQEALTNARKHSGAHKVRVSLDELDNRAFIRITDDGSGFDASLQGQDKESHFGLSFMQERMAEIRGSFKIDSIPGAGTVVEIEVPTNHDLEESK